MTTGRINQGTVAAVRFPPRAAWAPGILFFVTPFSFPLSLSLSFLHILRRVGRPTLDRHQGCSVTRVRAYSHECSVPSAHARTRGESIANSNSGRVGPRPRAEGRGFAIERMSHSVLSGGGLPGRFYHFSSHRRNVPLRTESQSSKARDAKGG